MCSFTHFHNEKPYPTAAGPDTVLLSMEAPSLFSLKVALYECGKGSRWLDEDEDVPVLEISEVA